VGEVSLIQDQRDRATGDGEERQVLPVGGKLLPDLIEGADPGAGKVAHAGEVDRERERAAGAGSKQPPGELNGGAGIGRASCLLSVPCRCWVNASPPAGALGLSPPTASSQDIAARLVIEARPASRQPMNSPLFLNPGRFAVTALFPPEPTGSPWLTWL